MRIMICLFTSQFFISLMITFNRIALVKFFFEFILILLLYFISLKKITLFFSNRNQLYNNLKIIEFY